MGNMLRKPHVGKSILLKWYAVDNIKIGKTMSKLPIVNASFYVLSKLLFVVSTKCRTNCLVTYDNFTISPKIYVTHQEISNNKTKEKTTWEQIFMRKKKQLQKYLFY